MYYEKLENGDLVIGAVTKNEQEVIDSIIVTIQKYEATFTKFFGARYEDKEQIESKEAEKYNHCSLHSGL
jgi:hypothetical protein